MTLTGDNKVRCAWSVGDPLYEAYHDEEWGVSVHDDRELFERLMLEGFQAGLAWITILRKREHFFRAFDGWDADKIAGYGPADVARLLVDPGIVRNRLKVKGAVQNANAYLRVREEFGSFDSYIWSFTGGGPLVRPAPATLADVPVTTPESDAMSKDLKRRGFTFVGSTICYAFMQSAGLVNDHIVGCFRAAS
ncbi:MAG: DNA-3-methyladenine glycosylase I [Thermomicrobiales bacterium]